MKLRKEKTWQYETMGTEGNSMLFGVNIFEYEWDFVKKLIINNREIGVYSVRIGNSDHLFGAQEVSNCVWNFYLLKY